MNAVHGTPTIWEKIGAVFGFGGLENAAILAGDRRDLSEAEREIVELLQPLLHAFESAALTDLVGFVKEVLAASKASTVSEAVGEVQTAAITAGGVILSLVDDLGKTSLVTLVSAALASLGKINLPV